MSKPDRPAWRYESLAEEISRLVVPDMPFLPSQRDLERQFGANRRTIQRALDLLEKQGMLVHVEGRGYGSAKRPAARPATRSYKVGFPIWATHFSDINLSSPFSWHAHTLESIKNELTRIGFELDIQLVGPQAKPDYDKIQRLCEVWDAVIIEPFEHSKDHRIGIGADHPFEPLRKTMVILGNVQGGTHNCVYADVYGGAKLAVEHLVECGARRIFFTGDPRQLMPNSFLRTAGVEQAAAGHHKVELIFSEGGHHSIPAVYNLIARELAKGRNFDAIIASSPYAALGSIRALYEAKIDIGREVQMVAFGGLPVLQYFSPRPTMIDVDTAAVGREAVRIAKELILNDGVPRASQVINTFLVPQETTQHSANTRQREEPETRVSPPAAGVEPSYVK